MLSAIVIFAALGFQAARAQTMPDNAAIEKLRTKVQKIGVGPDARIEVKLRDATKLKGYVSAATQDSFTIVDKKSGASQNLNYADVAEVKKPGGGLSTRTWIILAGVATAAIIVGVTVVKPIVCDGGAGC
jgi:hypothetical protein